MVIGLHKSQAIRLLLGFVLLCSLAVTWMYSILELRRKELEHLLKYNPENIEKTRGFALVNRFQRLIISRGRKENLKDFILEGRLMQSLMTDADSAGIKRFNWKERLSLKTLVWFNWLAGAHEPYSGTETLHHETLEKAFILEMQRDFKAAIENYDIVITYNQNPAANWLPYAILHRAYCRALLGQRTSAIADLHEVMRITATRTDIRRTATTLLGLIEHTAREIAAIDMQPTSEKKATAYYEITAYQQAVRTFAKLDSKKLSRRSTFQLARSHEELGDTTAAVDLYRVLIREGKADEWTRSANRRLFALGAFYGSGKQYRTESKANLEKGVVSDIALSPQLRQLEILPENTEARKIPLSKDLTDSADSPSEKFQPVVVDQSASVYHGTAPKQSAGNEKIEKPRSDITAKFIMRDGNEIIGSVLAEDRDDIRIYSLFGILTLDKSAIVKRIDLKDEP